MPCDRDPCLLRPRAADGRARVGRHLTRTRAPGAAQGGALQICDLIPGFGVGVLYVDPRLHPSAGAEDRRLAGGGRGV